MSTRPASPGFNLNAFLDYFIPEAVQNQPDMHRRARMFMLSHVFGPFLGNTIPIYLFFFAHIGADYRFWTFLISILAFWIYPFVLRATKLYHTLAFLSVQNLTFCILWACYSYGGIYSPFLPWTLVIPVLAFRYLPTTGLIRNVLLIEIFGSLGLFMTMVIRRFPFPAVDLAQLQLIGLVSIIAASIYVAMMALYFANVLREQSREYKIYERELGLAEHLRNMTQAAQQATTAKADFVAAMSHELRTPLNAVIGYSQLLLEDARSEGDEQFAADLEHIYKAGVYLLQLVDDILDFSKIEAGKMQSLFSTGRLNDKILPKLSEIRETLALHDYTLNCETPASAVIMTIDWEAFRKAVGHLIAGVSADGGGGVLDLSMSLVGDHSLQVRLIHPRLDTGPVEAERLFDVFSDESDASSTKYGGTGISLALSLRFAQMIGGSVSVDADGQGRRVYTLLVPTHGRDAESAQLAA